jgi:hypothetical protein
MVRRAHHDTYSQDDTCSHGYNAVMKQDVYMQILAESLSVLDDVLNASDVNYRIIGSLLIAALNGKPHRTIGDIDVVLDVASLDKVVAQLKERGFVLEHNRAWGFEWIELNHKHLIGFTFLLVGEFRDSYFSCDLKNHLRLHVSNAYLRPTEYTLCGTTFIGIPVPSIVEGLLISHLNPKRTLDRKVIKRIFGEQIPRGDSIDRSFTVYLFGVRLPYVYSFFSRIYNVFGGLRVLLGKKYEVWE